MKAQTGGNVKKKATAKAKPKQVLVDPSSSIPKMREAQKKASAGYKNSSGTDYEVSRVADVYAKELKKIGIPVDVTKWAYYKPPVGSRAYGIDNKSKRSLSTSKRKAASAATNKSYSKVESTRLSKSGAGSRKSGPSSKGR